ncbi:MAG: hypothetical protein GXP54_06055 [Deltaproteobacteria bacterium]|nr:hypothetical protein [Deltaproteobacteria bacterium]
MRLFYHKAAVALVTASLTLACGAGMTQVQNARSQKARSLPVAGSSKAAAPYRTGVKAPADGMLGIQIPIYDPSGRSLAAFHDALRRARDQKGQARIVFYGASHVAGDIFTGYIRRELQRRYGDAGHGFVMPARPWRTYRQADVNISSTNTWHTDRVSKPDDRKDGWYGLAGMSVSSGWKKNWGEVSTTKDNRVGRRVSRFELFYLKQPRGGRLDVKIDHRRVKRLRTWSKRIEPGYAVFKVRDGRHTFGIRPVGDGEVRIFGVAMERDVPGVILDTLGIPGSRARYQLEWNPDLYREHLRRRRPDLVVLAYGTNESGDDVVPIEKYEEDLRAVLDRVKDAVPSASCLLIGPSDRPIRQKIQKTQKIRDKRETESEYRFLPRPRTAQVIEVQRRVAEDYGCGFFDLVAFMGGPMSMIQWVNADPPYAAQDYVHFNRLGYERLGEVLLKDLLDGFE